MKTKLQLSTAIFFLLTSCLFAQGGINWDPASDISMSMYGNEHPRIVLDRSGDPMVLWGNSGNNNAYFSKWNGSGFTTPMIVNTGIPCFAASWAGPDIAAHGDTVYVVIKETPEMTNYAYLFSSFNGGTSFGSPVQIDIALADSISRFPAITTDNAGNPIVSYMKIDPDFSNARWVVTRSNDFGATFGTDILASNWSGGDVCDCCPASVTSSGNTVAVMYRDNNSNIRDMWCGISNDAGNTFSGGFGLDNPDWMLMACPSSGPDGVIVGDTLHSVLMSGYTGNYLVYYSKSSISGMLNDTVKPITGLLPGMTTQNFPRIATDGSAMGIVWKQTISGQDQLPLLFTNNITNGFPSQTDTVDLGDITNADIAILDGTIHIVWEDGNSGTVKYRSGTFNSVLSVNNESADDMLKIYPNPATNNLNIQISNAYSGPVEMSIYDMLGQKILTKTGIVTNGSMLLDITSFTQGIYVVELTVAHQHFSANFLKQ
jgi:hypothetical protein